MGDIDRAGFLRAMEARTGISQREIDNLLKEALNLIMETVENGDRVIFRGFGALEPRIRHPRRGQNPHTGEWLEIKGSVFPGFHPGKIFKDRVNKGRGRQTSAEP